jgi:flagellar basal-body rod protein FlgC
MKMGILTSLEISGSGLTAQRLRMDVIANNIANTETTRTADGQPYKRQQVVFAPIMSAMSSPLAASGSNSAPEEGVQVAAVVADERPPRMVYDPSHPDANADGYVAYPDIDLVTEMTDMMSATRAYEANVTALNAAKSMAMKALEIGRG